MKKFYQQHHNTVLWQAFQSSVILSLFIYGIFRLIFYEFPLSWQEEAVLFIRMFMMSSFIISTLTAGIAILYRSVLKLKTARIKS